MITKDEQIEKGLFRCSIAKLTCPCCGNEVRVPHRFSDGMGMKPKNDGDSY